MELNMGRIEAHELPLRTFTVLEVNGTTYSPVEYKGHRIGLRQDGILQISRFGPEDTIWVVKAYAPGAWATFTDEMPDADTLRTLAAFNRQQQSDARTKEALAAGMGPGQGVRGRGIPQ